MTLTPEEHKAATELAERIQEGRHYVIVTPTEMGLPMHEATILARALLDRNADIERLTEANAALKSEHATSMVTWMNAHTQDVLEIGSLKRIIDDNNNAIAALTRERDEARRVVGHMMKRLNDEYGVELSEEWAQRVAGGKHDVPFPESTLRDELETVKRELVDAEETSAAWLKRSTEARAELSALRTRLEDEEKDTTRLDWLENKWVDDESSPLTEYEGQWHADGMPNGPMTDDMRAAIDAAMSATQPEPAKPVCPTCKGSREIIIANGQPNMMGKCPDCSAPQPAVVVSVIPMEPLEQLQAIGNSQPATGQTAQPRIWRVDWKDGHRESQTAACLEREKAESYATTCLRLEYNYARVQFSDDNGATWVDEQTAQEPKICSCCGCPARADERGHENPIAGGFYCDLCSPIHTPPGASTGVCDGCWPISGASGSLSGKQK